MAESKRIELIDAIKGFAILWIVIFHIPIFEHCAAIRTYYHVPMFFMISGMFFRMSSFGSFLGNKVRRLLVPFAVFYLIAYVLYVGYGLVASHWVFSWREPLALLDLFSLNNENQLQALALNYPLWFLIALFNISIIYYAVNWITKNDIWRLLICAVLYFVGMLLIENGIHGLFLLGASLRYLIYFAIGNILLPYLLRWIVDVRGKVWVFLLCSVLLVVFTMIDCVNSWGLIFVARVLCFMGVAAVVLDVLIDRVEVIKRLLVFFGRLSIVVLGVHKIFIWGLISLGFVGGNYFEGVLLWIAVCVLCAISGVVIERYFPWMIGKKVNKI